MFGFSFLSKSWNVRKKFLTFGTKWSGKWSKFLESQGKKFQDKCGNPVASHVQLKPKLENFAAWGEPQTDRQTERMPSFLPLIAYTAGKARLKYKNPFAYDFPWIIKYTPHKGLGIALTIGSFPVLLVH